MWKRLSHAERLRFSKRAFQGICGRAMLTEIPPVRIVQTIYPDQFYFDGIMWKRIQ